MVLSFLLNSQEDVERSSVYVNDIENDLASCGLTIHVKCITNAPHVEDVREVVMNVIPEKEQTFQQKPVEKKTTAKKTTTKKTTTKKSA